MRNRNHNRRGVLNTSNPDWHEDRGNYGHGYQNHGYDNDRGSDNFNYGNSYGYGASIGGRYDSSGSDRNYGNRGNYGDTQYTRDSGLNRGRYQGDRDEGSQGSNDWRSSYGNNDSRDYLNYGSERGANDRARDEYRYSDRNKSYQGGGSSYGGGNYGSDYRGRRDDNDRGWWDKTSDEVSSWFGDEDAERRRDRDRIEEGKHRGKGPKGYNRSDDRIKEDINDRLSDDVYVDASEIEVTVTQGEVTLTGSVNQRNEKRRAEDIAEQVSGVKNVENRIRLSQSASSGDQWSTSSQANRGVGSTVSTGNRNKVKETLN
jgi:osmotically-inducible protein OsmY